MSEHFSGPQDGIETPRTKRDTAGYLLLLVASRFASEGIHNSTTFNSPSVTKTAMMITMMMMMEIVGLRVVIKEGSRKFRRNPTPGLSLFSNSEKPRFRSAALHNLTGWSFCPPPVTKCTLYSTLVFESFSHRRDQSSGSGPSFLPSLLILTQLH